MKKQIAVICLLVLAGCGRNYSTGKRVGVITKLSEKGIIFKSYEGEMLMALPSTSGITTPEKFEFSVRTQNKEAISKLDEALVNSDRVEIRYTQWFLPPPTIDTKYEIIDVLEVAK